MYPPFCALRENDRLMARDRTDQGGLLPWKGSLGPFWLLLVLAFAVWLSSQLDSPEGGAGVWSTGLTLMR